MKILHVLSSLNFSGVEMMLACSINNWKQAKITSYILATGYEIGPAYNLLKKKGYKINHISFAKHKIFGPFIRLLSFFFLLNFLLKNKFDIIHIHTEGNNFKFCLCAILSGHKKIIRTIQNVFFPSLIFRLRRKVVFKFCKFFKVKFISAGDSVKKNELINYNLKTLRIYNFYDDNKFYFINNNLKQKLRAKYKIPRNTLVLLSVGNCSNIKNHNLIFKSLSILPKNLNWIYFHIGEEDYNKSERKLAKQLDIQKKCKFLGAYYDWRSIGFISDIFLMPSLQEGLPCSAIEAGAIGLIPILSKRPGNVDILSKIKGTIGIKLDPISLKQAILKIHSMKKKQRLNLSFSVHKQIKKHFSKKNITSYIKIYKSI